jgi:MFS transporter, PAT family, beta-lactamase induction signal transducer AmpG
MFDNPDGVRIHGCGIGGELSVAATRPLPPVWMMGLGFLPLGVSGAILLFTVPELLAANHVPEQHIASVTAIGLFPTFGSFILSPLLDWRFSRRFYAMAFTTVGALCGFGALVSINNLPLLTAMLFTGNLGISLAVAAVGGWFGNLIETDKKGRLGAWFNVANLGGFGVTAALAMSLLRSLPYILGAGILSSLILLALPLYWAVPCPPADSRLASESIRNFFREVLGLLKKPSVLWTLPILLLPAADFALTNTLGGMGHDFHASEALVGLLGGVGTAVAGVVGSLLIPRIESIATPRPLYLLVGTFGALFTLGLVALPHNPTTFGVAILAENFFQGAAFSVQTIIILKTIGHNNPLAATQFGLLYAAGSLPLVYMQVIDGNAYGLFGGVNGSYLADALVSGTFCLILGLVVWFYRAMIAQADSQAEGATTSG